MKWTTRIAASACAASLLGSTTGVSVVAPQPPGRLLVVISDLHLGVGRADRGWHAFEDFRWATEFKGFLDEVHRRGQGKTDLVIAGDAFELWQSLANDCADANKDYGCTEQEAVARLKRVFSAHGDALGALGGFARSGENRVVFVPGNHDAALLFPAVANAVVEAIAAGAERVRVDPAGYWLSPDGSVLVEHGHQIGHEVNKFRGWPLPFLGESARHLERPWGEQFVQSFYNQYEVKYPIIDNVSEEGVGIRYAREVEGWAGITKALGRFVSFYLTRLSWTQHVSALGSDQSPEWDMEAIRSQGVRFLVESLPSDDPLGRAARHPDTQLGVTLDGFSDEELRSICDARAQIYEYQLEHSRQATVSRCPAKDQALGAVGQSILRRSRSAVLSEYLVGRHRELSRPDATRPQIRLFIYGHTHLADAGFRPMSVSHPDWDPQVVNSGAWQRTVRPEQLESLRCRVKAGSSLIELMPEDLPACYSAIFVHPFTDRPQAALQFWALDSKARWGLSASCPWVSPCGRGGD